jgi:magnesium transporter
MLQERTMVLRENIFDRQRVLSGILRSERFPNDIYPRLQLMIKDVNSLISHTDFSFQRLDYIQDSALGLINIEQNEVVKIFSVAAVVFLPATLVASIYGMNFRFMPELDWVWTLPNGWNIPLGYIFALGLMILASGLTMGYFRYKKWL